MTVKDAAETDMVGQLYLSQSGWLLLQVPNALMRGHFDALNEPGIEMPVSGTLGKPNAHVSIMTPMEVSQLGGPQKITERGRDFHYSLGKMRVIDPGGWPEMSRCWIIDVKSPELEKLRKSYGLSALPNKGEYPFHLTVAVRRKNVLRPNEVSKGPHETTLPNRNGTGGRGRSDRKQDRDRRSGISLEYLGAPGAGKSHLSQAGNKKAGFDPAALAIDETTGLDWWRAMVADDVLTREQLARDRDLLEHDYAFEKASVNIPGIPDIKDLGDISKLEPGEILDFVIQLHHARKAGRHYDVRFGSPKTGLYSWATKKEWPEPKGKIALFQQPLHHHGYLPFEGTLRGGYGAGTVRTHRKGKIVLTKRTPDKISFTTADVRYPQRFTLVRTKSDNGKTWLLINSTPVEEVPYKKVQYKKIPAHHVEDALKKLEPGSSVQAKIDGAASLTKVLKDGVEVMSYRVSKETGRPIVHTERVFHGRPGLEIPKDLVGTVLKGELYGTKHRAADKDVERSDIRSSGEGTVANVAMDESSVPAGDVPLAEAVGGVVQAPETDAEDASVDVDADTGGRVLSEDLPAGGDNERRTGPRYSISGAILGVLGGEGDAVKDFGLEVTEDLGDDPWKAVVRTSKPLTLGQLQQFHDRHRSDVDALNVPYYFNVHDEEADRDYVWYSDDKTPMPINSSGEIEAAKAAGAEKGLKAEHLDFAGGTDESIEEQRDGDGTVADAALRAGEQPADQARDSAGGESGLAAGGSVIPPQELGGLLNAAVAKSIERQKERGIQLKNMLYDIQSYGGKDIDEETPYADRMAMLRKVLPHLPEEVFHLPDEETTAEGAQSLWEKVKGGRHPLTQEGIVIHPPTGKPSKAKLLEEQDVHITDIFPGEGKYEGRGAGGFTYALTPDGPTVGRVGTGFSDELREELHRNAADYRGRVAKVRSQGRFPATQALRAPAFLGFHEDYPTALEKAADELPYRPRVEMFGINPKGELLSGIYDDDRTLGVFGGGIDEGEDPATAAAREMFEESGYPVTDPVLLDVPAFSQSWATPPPSYSASDAQKQRKARYGGSTTQYVMGRIGEKTEEPTDPSNLEDIQFRPIAEALQRMELGPEVDEWTKVRTNARKRALQRIEELLKEGKAQVSGDDDYWNSPPNKEGRRCPGCSQVFKEIEPLPGVTMCEACERYGPPKTKKAEVELKDRIETAAKKTRAPKSKEQADAGNYQKGKFSMHGLRFAIETPKGRKRTGVDSDGRRWSITMRHHYGYVQSTDGADGDSVDVFIGDRPNTELVFVVDQRDPEAGTFDEHKVMFGFETKTQAKAAYLQNYETGWKGCGEITPLTVEQFKIWLEDGDQSKPMADQAFVLDKQQQKVEDQTGKPAPRIMVTRRHFEVRLVGMPNKLRKVAHSSESVSLMKQADVSQLVSAIASPHVRKWMEDAGYVWPGFQGQGSLVDRIRDQRFQEETFKAMQGAPTSSAGLIAGIERLLTGRHQPGGSEQAQALASTADKVAPYLAALYGPKALDVLGGSSSGHLALAQALAKAGQHLGLEPDEAFKLAGQIHTNTMGKVNGIPLDQLAPLIQPALSEGLLSWEGKDPEAWTKTLQNMAAPVRAIEGSYGMALPQAFQAYAGMQPTRFGLGGKDLAGQIYGGQYYSRGGGLLPMAAQRAGQSLAGYSPRELNQMDMQLRMQAGGSPMGNVVGATARAREMLQRQGGDFKPGGAAATYWTAMSDPNTDLYNIMPGEWIEAMRREGIDADTAGQMLGQTARNSQFLNEELIHKVRANQTSDFPMFATTAQQTRGMHPEMQHGAQMQTAHDYGFRGHDPLKSFDVLHRTPMQQVRADAKRHAELQDLASPFRYPGVGRASLDALKRFGEDPSYTVPQALRSIGGGVETAKLPPQLQAEFARTKAGSIVIPPQIEANRTVGLAEAIAMSMVKMAKANPTVAIDLDGTIAKMYTKFDPKTIPDPRPGVKEALKKFKSRGWRIIVNTVRGDKKQLAKYMKDNDLAYDYINENPDQPPGTSDKIIADVYIDDRAVDARQAWSDLTKKVVRRMERVART
jgi:8-oxo-dGTP pyrophosphatase MutT (NUDIX family)